MRRTTALRFSSVGISSPSWLSRHTLVTPRIFPHLASSAARRRASGPPAMAKWPTSPFVRATNLTAWPLAAHLAAVPAATYSQSSGWAPKTMMRILSEAMVLLFIEGEQLADLVGLGPPAVLADLERLGVLDLGGLVLAVVGLERRAELLRRRIEPLPEPVADLLLPRGPGRLVLRIGHQPRVAVGAALEELRVERLDRREFLLDHVVDRDHDVGREGIGPLEVVLREEEDRVLREIGR